MKIETIKEAAIAVNAINALLNRETANAKRSPTQLQNINEACGLSDQLQASLGGLMMLQDNEFKQQ